MPKPFGRATSKIHTPIMVREHLLAVGPEGDYIAHIHQHVKMRLRSERAGYVWPRAHSFKALIRNLIKAGLVEATGQRKAGALDPALGFQMRTYIRLTPGSEAREEWHNPVRAVLGLPIVRVAEPPPRPPGPGRPRPQPRPPAAEEEAGEELSARIGQLEGARQALVQRLVAASEAPGRVEDFQALHQSASRFLGSVRAVYDREQFPAAAEAMEQLGNCIRLFQQERAMTQARVQALRNCQNWARLLAEALSGALAVPRGVPRTAPKPAPPAPPRQGVTPQQEALRQAWLQTPAGKRFSELRELGSYGRHPAENVEYDRLYQRYLESDMTPAERRAWRKELREAAAMDVAAEREAAAAERAEAGEAEEEEEE